MNRRLSAILAADVVGYSRMMSQDEARTHAVLQDLRASILEPATARHDSRIFKTTGDGVLVAYRSAVDAVVAAVEIQQSLGKRNATAPAEERIDLRIALRDSSTAQELAAKALAMDDSQADAYAMLSNIEILRGRHGDAEADCQKALALNPGSEAMAHCARNLIFLDRSEESLALVQKAMRLSPYYPAWYLCVLGGAERELGKYDEALVALRDCSQRLPGSAAIDAGLAAAYSLAGEDAAAQATVADLLKQSPTYSAAQFARTQLFRDPGKRDRLVAAVRKAGLPE